MFLVAEGIDDKGLGAGDVTLETIALTGAKPKITEIKVSKDKMIWQKN